MADFVSQSTKAKINEDIYVFNAHGERSVDTPRIHVTTSQDNKEDNNIYITLVPTGKNLGSEYTIILFKSLQDDKFKSELNITINSFKSSIELIKSRDELKTSIDKLQSYLDFNILVYGISHLLFQYKDIILSNLKINWANATFNMLIANDDNYEIYIFLKRIGNIINDMIAIYVKNYKNSTNIKDYFYILFTNFDIIFNVVKILVTKNILIYKQSLYVETKIYIPSKQMSFPPLNFTTNAVWIHDNYLTFSKTGLIKIDRENPISKILIKVPKPNCKIIDCNEFKKDKIRFMYNNSIFPRESDMRLEFDKTNKIPTNKYSVIDFVKQLYINNIKNNIIILNVCNGYSDSDIATKPDIVSISRSMSIQNRDSEISRIASINTTRDEIIAEYMVKFNLNYDTARKTIILNNVPIVYQGSSYIPSFFALSEAELKYKYLKYKNKYINLRQQIDKLEQK